MALSTDTAQREWKRLDLKSFLEEENNYHDFEKFCKETFCEENLFFFKEAQEFKRHCKSSIAPSELVKQAQQIADTYVRDGAPLECNLNGEDKQAVLNFLEKKQTSEAVTADELSCLFDSCKEWVYLLMQGGTFPRYLEQKANFQKEAVQGCEKHLNIPCYTSALKVPVLLSITKADLSYKGSLFGLTSQSRLPAHKITRIVKKSKALLTIQSETSVHTLSFESQPKRDKVYKVLKDYYPSAATDSQDVVEAHSATIEDDARSLTANDWEILLKGARQHRCKKGTVIITQGVAVSKLYFLQQGSLDVVESNVKLSTISPGETFGEMGLVTRCPASVTVYAAESGVIFYEIDAKYLYNCITADAVLAGRFYFFISRLLSHRLVRLQDMNPQKKSSIPKTINARRKNKLRKKVLLPAGDDFFAEYPAKQLKRKVSSLGYLVLAQSCFTFYARVFGLKHLLLFDLADRTLNISLNEKQLCINRPGDSYVFELEDAKSAYLTLRHYQKQRTGNESAALRVVRSQSSLLPSGYSLSPKDWETILSTRATELVHHPAGKTIISVNSDGQSICHITSGSAVVVLASGKEIATLEQGDIFGETSYLQCSKPSANVVAAEPTSVHHLRAHQLDQLLKQQPELGAKFFGYLACVLSKRIREQNVKGL